jgi:hypothetical protein
MDCARATLWDYAWVSRSVDPSVRNEDLSYHHHRLVAKLPQDEQVYWLNYACKNKLGIRDLSSAMKADAIKEEGSNYDNLIDFIDHMKAYANEVLQLADALHEKRIFVSPNQKQIILDQASLIHGLWDNLEYELRKGS